MGAYAQQILGYVESLGAQAKQARAEHLDAESVAATQAIRSRRDELRSVLAEYLLADPLPTTAWALSLHLGGTSPHGQVMLQHPGELTTSFMVNVRGDAAWGCPRKVGEIAPGLSLQVGFKKAFLRSSLHPDIHTLDDFRIARSQDQSPRR